jgi:hypothetical protein
MVKKQNSKPSKNNKPDFESRIEQFHDQSINWGSGIYPHEEMSFNMVKDPVYTTRYLIILKSLEPIHDNPEKVDDILSMLKSLKYTYGNENVYLHEGHFGHYRIYCFVDLLSLSSRT